VARRDVRTAFPGRKPRNFISGHIEQGAASPDRLYRPSKPRSAERSLSLPKRKGYRSATGARIVDRPFSRELWKTRRQHHSFGHHWVLPQFGVDLLQEPQSPFIYLPAEVIGIALVTDKPIAGTRRSPDPFDDQEIAFIARAARAKTYALVAVGVMLAIAVACASRDLIHTLDYHRVVESVRTSPTRALLLAGLATLASYSTLMAMTCRRSAMSAHVYRLR
jgi:hypothetical protein